MRTVTAMMDSVSESMTTTCRAISCKEPGIRRGEGTLHVAVIYAGEWVLGIMMLVLE